MATNKNIFLIGFMGCGKSTMARMLSRDTNLELIEMDEMIETESMIYPNPANKEINVSVENMTKVTVYNSIGQMVFAQDASSDVMTISTESMTNGIYYVTIETSEGTTSTQKVVVNK